MRGIMYRRIDGFRKPVLLSVCILAGTLVSPAQNGFQSGRATAAAKAALDSGADRGTGQFRHSAAGRHRAQCGHLLRRRPRRNAGRFAIKTNLAYALGLQTPNLAFEYAPGRRSSIEAAVGYNDRGNLWDYSKTGPDYDPANSYKRRLDHIFVKAEYRHRFRGRFDGHFVGAGLHYAKYRTGEVTVSRLFEPGYDYYGNMFGGALSYGYLWRWSRRWGAEFTLSAGVAVLTHNKGSIVAEGGSYIVVDPVGERKTYFGPTGVGVKLVFIIE